MKKLTISLVLSIIVIGVFSSKAFAQDTSISDLLGDNSTQQSTTTEETGDTNNDLSMYVPTQTENPSYVLSFTDPSSESKGVQIEIDSTSYVDITSPYTLPALSIGHHVLNFKYVDTDGTTQILEKEIIIIPRAPILDAPVVGAENITISGTGLARAEIIVLLSSGGNVVTQTGDIDGEGEWTMDIALTNLSNEVYSVNAYTRKYGYASNLSETIKFEIGDTVDINNHTNNQTFSFENITLAYVKSLVTSNLDLIIASGIFLLVGILIGILIKTSRNKNIEKKEIVKIEKKITSGMNNGSSLTLREKLQGKKEEGQPIKQQERQSMTYSRNI